MTSPRNAVSSDGNLDPAVRDAMLGAVPRLRAFAISLCGSIDRADDLVQETLLRALSHIDQFEPGTNMPAWLFTILRNLFRSDYRKRRREVADQREALILIGASGMSYEDAAQICGSPIGTIKSRVNRARGRLAELLSIESVDDLGPDQTTRAVLMNVV